MAFIAWAMAGIILPASGYLLLIAGIVCTSYYIFILLLSFVSSKTSRLSSTTYATNYNNHRHHDVYIRLQVTEFLVCKIILQVLKTLLKGYILYFSLYFYFDLPGNISPVWCCAPVQHTFGPTAQVPLWSQLRYINNQAYITNGQVHNSYYVIYKLD